jgi:streptogramin lyase
MSLQGEVLAEYPVPTPNSGPRAMLTAPDGRLFFSQHDSSSIGEVRWTA